MTVRELNGWSPSTVTYAADGSLLSVAVCEPRFRPGDVDVLLASRRADAAPRGAHGYLLSEATDPALQYDWVVPLPTRDFVARKLKAAQDERAKRYPDEDTTSLLWRVERP